VFTNGGTVLETRSHHSKALQSWTFAPLTPNSLLERNNEKMKRPNWEPDHVDYLDTDAMYQFISTKIKNVSARSLLDVGCFKGNLLKQMSDIQEYTGIEIVDDWAQEAERRCAEKHFSCRVFGGNRSGAFENLAPPQQHYDVVYIGAVFEYVVIEHSTERANLLELHDQDILETLLKEYLDKYTPEYVIWQIPPQWNHALNPAKTGFVKQTFEKHLDLLSVHQGRFEDLKKFPLRQISIWRNHRYIQHA